MAWGHQRLKGKNPEQDCAARSRDSGVRTCTMARPMPCHRAQFSCSWDGSPFLSRDPCRPREAFSVCWEGLLGRRMPSRDFFVARAAWHRRPQLWGSRLAWITGTDLAQECGSGVREQNAGRERLGRAVRPPPWPRAQCLTDRPWSLSGLHPSHRGAGGSHLP